MVGVEEVIKKLSLWHTKTFRPILTHDDLEPIMAALGFAPLPAAPVPGPGPGPGPTWREYTYRASKPPPRLPPRRADALAAGADRRTPPRLRLPSPRLDGLHLLTYKAFVDAVAFYVGPARVADLFHVRAMPLIRAHDRVLDKTFRPMKDCRELDDDSCFVYREGTLDQLTKISCSYNKDKENNIGNINNGGNGAENCHNSSSAANPIYTVPLKDLFPQEDASQVHVTCVE